MVFVVRLPQVIKKPELDVTALLVFRKSINNDRQRPIWFWRIRLPYVPYPAPGRR